jgi:hypothetical protein
MSDENLWHQLYWREAHAKSVFDSDNRPGGPKNGISSMRSKTAALPCFPAKGDTVNALSAEGKVEDLCAAPFGPSSSLLGNPPTSSPSL